MTPWWHPAITNRSRRRHGNVERVFTHREKKKGTLGCIGPPCAVQWSVQSRHTLFLTTTVDRFCFSCTPCPLDQSLRAPQRRIHSSQGASCAHPWVVPGSSSTRTYSICSLHLFVHQLIHGRLPQAPTVSIPASPPNLGRQHHRRTTLVCADFSPPLHPFSVPGTRLIG